MPWISAQGTTILQATEGSPPFHPSKKKMVERSAETVENDVLKKIIEDQGYKVLDIQ